MSGAHEMHRLRFEGTCGSAEGLCLHQTLRLCVQGDFDAPPRESSKDAVGARHPALFPGPSVQVWSNVMSFLALEDLPSALVCKRWLALFLQNLSHVRDYPRLLFSLTLSLCVCVCVCARACVCLVVTLCGYACACVSVWGRVPLCSCAASPPDESGDCHTGGEPS